MVSCNYALCMHVYAVDIKLVFVSLALLSELSAFIFYQLMKSLSLYHSYKTHLAYVADVLTAHQLFKICV